MLRSKKGFTLIELMIVVAIIGILAAVAIPKFADMLEKAREGATKGNAGALKSAVSIYYGDNTGAWPGGIGTSSSDAATYNSFFTKYMDKLPPVKVTHPGSGAQLAGSKTDVTVISTTAPPQILKTTAEDGWRYNKLTGDVWVNNGQTDTKTVEYSTYGYE